MKCGFGEALITPPEGSYMPGYLTIRRSTEVRDELYAKAFVCERGQQSFAVIVLDVMYLDRPEVQRIRGLVTRQTGIPEKAIMVSCTHTHTGGPWFPEQDGERSAAYIDWLVRQSATAALEAYRARRPAVAGIGSGLAEGLAFNRRYRMADGTVKTNPGIGRSDVLGPDGPADPEVLVLRIDDEAGQPMGVVVNFACHADTVGGTAISADFPGELSRKVKEALGAQTVCVFVLGACGDVNHVPVMDGRSVKRGEHHLWMGRRLAEAALQARQSAEPLSASGEPKIAVGTEGFHLTYRQPESKDIAAARRVLADEASPETEKTRAERFLLVLDNPKLETEIEIQLFRFGDAVIAGLPGEWFAEFGLELKRRAGFRHVIVNTICNGSTIGYIFTRRAFVEGSYETHLKNISRNPEGTGERMVTHALAGLDRLRKAGMEA